MTIQKIKNTKYNLQTFVGDSGLLTIGNIPNNMPNYVLYFEARGNKTVTKSQELHGAEEATIQITVQDTKDLGAGRWPYGVKLCYGSAEDTYIPDPRISNEAIIWVKPEVVSGTEDGVSQDD